MVSDVVQLVRRNEARVEQKLWRRLGIERARVVDDEERGSGGVLLCAGRRAGFGATGREERVRESLVGVGAMATRRRGRQDAALR